MGKEIRICLPFYKIAYSVFFTAVLSLVRGVSFTYEIGIALEPQMALLAAVFCADTYVQEIVSKRSEVARLYPVKNRTASIFRRMGIQEGYLLALAAAGYGMFEVMQKPFPSDGMQAGTEDRISLFVIYLAAVAVTLLYWGTFSLILACMFRTMWAGIGGCLVLWVITDSKAGEKILGKWNLFSYTFRNIEDPGDFSWVCGKAVCIICCMIMMAAVPKIIKKRG